ncbi:MAG: hypothetical protein II921_02275 [Treponema sp.]|nr:hypothetical protein [Treponema sp.]
MKMSWCKKIVGCFVAIFVAAALFCSCKGKKSDSGSDEVQNVSLEAGDKKSMGEESALATNNAQSGKMEKSASEESNDAKSFDEESTGAKTALGADARTSSRDALVRVEYVDWERAQLDPSKFIAEKHFSGSSIHDFSNLYVLGFSRDGKIAFVETQLLDGVGAERDTFFVQDLVEDEILVQIVGKDSELGGSDALKAFVAQEREKIDEAISSHAIVSGAFSYEPLPYSADGFFIDVEAKVVDTGKKLHEFIAVSDYTCIATASSGSRKVIREKKDVTCENVFICGCIKSPWENRLAVVIGEQRFGFEGYDIWYSFSGCDMRRGF